MSTWIVGRAWIAVCVAAALALSGCVAVERAPEPGFSAEELEQLHQTISDSAWSWTGFADELRPTSSGFEVVGTADFMEVYLGCLQEKGYPNGGMVGPDDPKDEASRQARTIAQFTCQDRYFLDPVEVGIANAAQLDYSYDYFEQSLIPCLASRGFVVNGEIPSREQFVEDLGQWHPYLAVDSFTLGESSSIIPLFDECPPTAPGAVPNQFFAGDEGYSQ